jgi:hypothetical protein
MADTKLYIVWRENLGAYGIRYKGDIIHQAETQQQAKDWVEMHYPNHGYEVERVVVRKNSPRGVKIGEWHEH